MELSTDNLIIETEDIKNNSDIDEQDLNYLCRLCGNYTKQLIPIFSGEGLEHKLHEKIMEHFSTIDDMESNFMPNNVCYQCTSTLLAWHELYHTWKEVNEYLKSLSKKIQMKHEITAAESVTEESITDEDLDWESVMFDSSTSHLNLKSDNMSVLPCMSDPLEVDSLVSKEIGNVDVGFKPKISERCELEDCTIPCTTSSAVQRKSSRSKSPRMLIANAQPKIDQTKTQINHSSSPNNSNQSTQLKCSDCSRQFPNNVTLTIHENEKKIIHRYQNVFNKAFDYLEHDAVSSEGTLECDHCHQMFKEKHEIAAHITWEHMCIKKFKCDSCDWDCATKCDLATHRSVHSIDKKLICQYCGGRTKSSKRFAYEEECSSDLVRCSCKTESVVSSMPMKRDSDASSARKKIVKLVRGTPLFKNTQSKIEPSQDTKDRTWWEDSEDTLTPMKRSTSRKTVCDVCGQNFATNYDMRKHKRLHGPKVICEVCNKEYCKSYISHHMQIHAEIKAYVCDKCGKRFAQLSSLRAHKVLENNIRTLMCNVCGMRFALSSRLQTHMKNHLPVKPFKCEDCDKDFGYIWQLRQHRVMHSEVRAFKCEHCSKAYKTKKHLRQHWKSTSCNQPFN